MSYRDLRNFAEMMRALGYPRLISLENFRQPNFPLVAEVLIWLAKRYEPNAEPLTEIETESERVMFVRSMAQFMATKANIKLNTKKIYQADGHAVKELLKISTLLYEAMKANSGAGDYRPDETAVPVTFDIGSKIQELKQTRALSSEITTKGATLFDLLRREVDLREVRQQVLAKNFEMADVEAAVGKATVYIQAEIEKNQKLIANVATDEANLDAKIEKKRVDLDRSQKRLATLKKVRPAFMDEFERLEEDLKKLYTEYIDKFRCLAFLEAEVEDYERNEENKMKERQAAMKQHMEDIQKQDNTELDIGLGRIARTSEDMMFEAEPSEPGGKVKGRANARVFGSMQADFDDLGSDVSIEMQDDELAQAGIFSDEDIQAGGGGAPAAAASGGTAASAGSGAPPPASGGSGAPPPEADDAAQPPPDGEEGAEPPPEGEDGAEPPPEGDEAVLGGEDGGEPAAGEVGESEPPEMGESEQSEMAESEPPEMGESEAPEMGESEAPEMGEFGPAEMGESEQPVIGEFGPAEGDEFGPPEGGEFGPPEGGEFGPPGMGGEFGPPEMGDEFGPPEMGDEFGPPEMGEPEQPEVPQFGSMQAELDELGSLHNLGHLGDDDVNLQEGDLSAPDIHAALADGVIQDPPPDDEEPLGGGMDDLGDAAPTGDDGEAPLTDDFGEAAPTDDDGETALTDDLGDVAPTDDDGESALTDDLGDVAPTEDGGEAPAMGDPDGEAPAMDEGGEAPPEEDAAPPPAAGATKKKKKKKKKGAK